MDAISKEAGQVEAVEGVRWATTLVLCAETKYVVLIAAGAGRADPLLVVTLDAR